MTRSDIKVKYVMDMLKSGITPQAMRKVYEDMLELKEENLSEEVKGDRKKIIETLKWFLGE